MLLNFENSGLQTFLTKDGAVALFASALYVLVIEEGNPSTLFDLLPPLEEAPN